VALQELLQLVPIKPQLPADAALVGPDRHGLVLNAELTFQRFGLHEQGPTGWAVASQVGGDPVIQVPTTQG
jgi:hypothetical protein